MSQDVVIYVIDIGDANMRGGVYINGLTQLVSTVRTPHEYPGAGSERLLNGIRAMVNDISTKAPPMQALAIAASGIMTMQPSPGLRSYGPFKDSELFVIAPNVDGLKYAALITLIDSLGFDVPIHVENDVNAALESDSHHQTAVGVSLGAGLGAAAKRNGKVIHVGETWSCFEVGHGMRWQLPEELSYLCHCGSVGCLEAAIGGWAMSARYGVAPEHAPHDIYDRMRDDVILLLPQAIASVVSQTGINTVLLSGKGAVGYAGTDSFLERICENTRQLTDVDGLTVELLDLGETAELHGAALALLRNNVLSTSPT